VTDAAIDPVAGDPLAGFRVISGDPTPTELAAVTAVVLALVEEAQDEEYALAAAASVRSGQSAWQRSQRAVRRPLRPGFGAWRGFSA